MAYYPAKYNIQEYNVFLYNGRFVYFEDLTTFAVIDVEADTSINMELLNEQDIEIIVAVDIDKGYPIVIDLMDYFPEKFRNLNLVI